MKDADIDAVLAKYRGLPKLVYDELERDLRTLIERVRNDAKVVDKSLLYERQREAMLRDRHEADLGPRDRTAPL